MTSSLIESITARYAEGGAPLMHEMGLRITAAEPGRVRFTLPVPPRLTHGGGVLCGQAILACMDTGMVFVMMSLDEDPEARFTTVQLQTSFKRGVPADVGEVQFEAHATKTGRTLVFGEIDLYLPDGPAPPTPPRPTCGCSRERGDGLPPGGAPASGAVPCWAMARRRPSGIADSPAARSVVGRTDIGDDSMVTAQLEGARRARLTLLVTPAVVTVLGVPAAITGRTGGTT